MIWKNWFFRKEKIYANYHLYKIPYALIEGVNQFEEIRDGYIGADEFWNICDCVTPDTYITTHDGDAVKMENVMSSNPVQAVNMDKKTMENALISHQFKRKVHEGEKLISVKTATKKIKVSKKHRLFVFDGLDMTERYAEDLKEGDMVVVAEKVESSHAKKIDKELAQFLGYVMGDGTIYYRPKSVHWTERKGMIKIEDEDPELLKFYGEMMKKKYGLKYNMNKYKPYACHRMTICNRKFVEKINEILANDNNVFMDKWGLRFKDIPETITKSDNVILGAFLRGLFDAEGSMSMIEEKSNITADKKALHTIIRIGMAKKIDMERVKYLLLRFGIRSTTNKTANNGGYSKRRDLYMFNLKIKDRISVMNFRKYIGFESEHKKKKLESCADFIKGRKNQFNKSRNYPFQKLFSNLVVKIGEKNNITLSQIEHTLHSKHQVSFFRKSMVYKIGDNLLSRTLNGMENEYGKFDEIDLMRNIQKSNLNFEPIQEIKEIVPDCEYLYDITVPAYENYIANGFLVHNSRMSGTKRNRFVSNILMKSRKRNLTYIFTAQLLELLDKRVRKVLDFCMPYDEKVFCNPHFVPIGEMKKGEKVLTHDGVFREVTGNYERDYKGNMFEVTPQHIRLPVKLTEGHPVLVAEPHFDLKYQINQNWNRADLEYLLDNFFKTSVESQAKVLGKKNFILHSKRKGMKNRLDFTMKWKPAEELARGDLIAIPILKTINDVDSVKISDYYKESSFRRKWKLEDGYWHYAGRKIKDEIKMDDDFLEFCGLYVGDGSAYHGQLQIAIDNTRNDNISKKNHIVKLFMKVFGIDRKNIKIKRKNGMSEILVGINYHPLCKFFRIMCGKGSENKHFPHSFLMLPHKKQKALLKGYLSADGHELKNCKRHDLCSIAFSTTSELLAIQVSQICLRLGSKVSLFIARISDIGTHTPYCGYISKKQFNSFITDDGYFLTPIRKIDVSHFEGKVYNLKVKDSESYMTKSLCVHNCAYPMLNREETVMKVQVFRTGYPTAGSYMKTFYFKTPEVFSLYSTNEEVDIADETKEKLTFRFQESPEHSPIFFETWEEADAHADKFWNKLVKQKGGLPF